VLPPRAAVGVADAVRALALLPDVPRHEVLACLGLDSTGPTSRPPRPPAPPQGTAGSGRTRAPREGAPPPPPPPPSLPGVPLGIVAVDHHPVLPDMVRSRQLRAVLSRPVPTDDLDVGAAVELVARGLPVAPAPRRHRSSLALGARLMVDIGAGMDPFRRDAEDVVRCARDLAGRSGVQVLQFRQVPTSAAGVGSGPTWTWAAHRRPASGTPVLVITDLGLAGPCVDEDPAGERDWCAFLAGLGRGGCRAVVLTPYLRARVPPALRRLATVLALDHRGRPRTARHAHGGAP